MKHKSAKTLSLFALAMINVAAVGTVKNWPLTAEYGFSSIFFLLLAAIIFFIPISLVSAELATGWPKSGGVFAWVKEAFGHRTGFLTIWLLWAQNVIFMPTFLSFIAASFAYAFMPDLAGNKLYMAGSLLVLFWAMTYANLKGMEVSKWISTFGVLFGTFIPGVLIILFGVYWVVSGRAMQIELSVNSLIPTITNIEQLVFFAGILLNLCGMEMSAVHVKDVTNPQRNYPRAILLSLLLVLGLSILGVLAIAIVIPKAQITLVAGSLQAFSYFVNAYGLSWLTPCFAILIALGALGSMSTWLVGPCRGLLTAAQKGDLPPLFRTINKQKMPVSLLIIQAVIVSFLGILFLFMPSVSSAFWIISALTAQLYLVMYVIMFSAAIKLRYKRPHVKRSYKIPGGNIGMWITSGIGILACLLTLGLGFLPPSQLLTGNAWFYVGFLAFGLIGFCVAPSVILLFQRPNWKQRLSHETAEE